MVDNRLKVIFTGSFEEVVGSVVFNDRIEQLLKEGFTFTLSGVVDVSDIYNRKVLAVSINPNF